MSTIIIPHNPDECELENRFGFQLPGDIDIWVNRNCPGVTVIRKWQCRFCGRWHHEGSLARGQKQRSDAGVRAGMSELRKLGEQL